MTAFKYLDIRFFTVTPWINGTFFLAHKITTIKSLSTNHTKTRFAVSVVEMLYSVGHCVEMQSIHLICLLKEILLLILYFDS